MKPNGVVSPEGISLLQTSPSVSTRNTLTLQVLAVVVSFQLLQRAYLPPAHQHTLFSDKNMPTHSSQA